MNLRNLSVVLDAADNVITVSEFKLWSRVQSGTTEDVLIADLIKTAQTMVENHCGVALTEKTLRMTSQGWPVRRLPLMFNPVTSIESVKYLDENGDQQTLSPSIYVADIVGAIRPTISRAWSQTWPVLYRHPSPVIVEYKCGHNDVNPVPRTLVQAVRMMASDLYENRESQITSQYFGERSVIENPTLSRILAPYVNWEL